MKASLYEKYNVPSGQYTDPLNTLHFLLRKAELGKHLTNSEWQWLEQQKLADAIELIQAQEAYRNSLALEIKSELRKLHGNRFIHSSTFTIPSVDSENALIFYKVNNLEELSDQESKFVGSGYKQFLTFNRIKNKHGIVDDIPYGEESIRILNKIDVKISLSASDLEWLYQRNITSVLNVFPTYFSLLCDKYKADTNQLADDTKFLLYVIFQKLEENIVLSEQEMQSLKQNDFLEALTIAQKRELSKLKAKYHATQVEDESPTHHLYKVLKKLESGQVLQEADLNYLRKRKLHKTVKFTFQAEADCLINKVKQGHGLRPDDIAWCKQHDFSEIIFLSLKKDYGVEHRNDTPENLLFVILEKLEAKERLSDEDVVWLESEAWCRPNYHNREDKIYIIHHTQEAHFYETEFQRIKNHWNLVNASAHWRKAGQPEQALKLTNNPDLIRSLKENKLKAALLTTRGGALRDIGELEDAEYCALEAIKLFPKSHNPYTLMGALCYATGRFVEGDKWFEKAVKRGAKPKDQDAEIRRILNKKKGKDREALIDHLLNKDPMRFSWARKLKATD
jgi:hypothetical protein